MSQAYPRVLGHIGLTVEDIDAAYEWYRDVLGFTPVMVPDTVTPEDGHFYNLAADAVGFEFEDTEGANDPDPADPGLFHLCVQDPNIEELVGEIVETGGEQLSDVWTIFPEYPEYKMCYCVDPWGNIVEVHSRGYEHMHANLAEEDPPAR